jgi:hypothetical protein
MKKLFLIGFLTLTFSMLAQKDIKIKNKSFEGVPEMGHIYPVNNYTEFNLDNWSDCGSAIFEGESPPDTHPRNYHGNNKKASEGYTYVGMVVRDNISIESIGQKLRNQLDSNYCYLLTIDLAKASSYQSYSRRTGKKVDYTNACSLRVWGGNKSCQSLELLAQSSHVNHYTWQTYQLKLSPKSNYKYIILEAFYKSNEKELLVYNGNILIDNMQDLKIIDCDESIQPIIIK